MGHVYIQSCYSSAVKKATFWKEISEELGVTKDIIYRITLYFIILYYSYSISIFKYDFKRNTPSTDAPP